MVRIPNENLVKTEFVNLTRFPIRRADVSVGVAYKEDPDRVRDLLFQIADDHPLALMEPEPQFYFIDFGSSSLDFTFGVWTRSDHFFEFRNQLRAEIKKRFDEAGIEIPFPHRTLYTGSVTDAFPIRIIGEPGDETIENREVP
jgi:small-conductance mechanosensitive channel